MASGTVSMRVSSVAWLYNDIDSVRHAARLSAEVTHNHPEGIKGAEATASAVFLAWTGHSKTIVSLALWITKPLSADWKKKIDADYKKRGGKR